MRLDLYLVAQKICPSRSKAQELIKQHKVEVFHQGQFKLISTPSFRVQGQPEIKVIEDSLLKYVARSGLKLEGVLQDVNFNVQGKKCLDVGSSTGGFSHCLLLSGAGSVVGVDVGQGQLHESLKEFEALTNFEKLHVKDIKQHDTLRPQEKSFDLIVVDVSFISLTQVLVHLVDFLAPQARLLALVKPQFELGAGHLKKGLVKSETSYGPLQEKIQGLCSELGLKVLDYLPSRLPGKEGNKEFFIYAELV